MTTTKPIEMTKAEQVRKALSDDYINYMISASRIMTKMEKLDIFSAEYRKLMERFDFESFMASFLMTLSARLDVNNADDSKTEALLRFHIYNLEQNGFQYLKEDYLLSKLKEYLRKFFND